MSSDLIVFGEDWGGLPSSTQHLMAHIARERKILWVNSIGLRKPRLNATDARRALTKLLSRPAACRTEAADIASDFTVINPKTLPAPSNGLERLLARKLLCRQLLPAIKAARLRRPILWISLPTAADLVGELGEIATVYYCGDDFSALAGVDHATVAAREKELNQKADLVLAASEVLATRFPGAKTRLLTHGVDYELFSTPCDRAPDLPQDGKPIAGFYGSLSEWLDIELLVATIQRMPHWNFVFIGSSSVDVSPLASLGNVRLPSAASGGALSSSKPERSTSRALPMRRAENSMNSERRRLSRSDSVTTSRCRSCWSSPFRLFPESCSTALRIEARGFLISCAREALNSATASRRSFRRWRTLRRSWSVIS